MQDILVIIDMQNDFVTGSLGTTQAQEIVPKIQEKIKNHNGLLIFTRDTHSDCDSYLLSQEGKNLPICHCIEGTIGHQIVRDLLGWKDGLTIDKDQFGSFDLVGIIEDYEFGTSKNVSIEMCGVCTDICVITNALLVKSKCPEVEITVDASCCAGVTPESHRAALDVMRSCQINVINDEGEKHD